MKKTGLLILAILFFYNLDTIAQVTSKTLDLPSFRSVYVNSNYTVYLKQTNKQEVKVDALTEIFEVSEFKVENDVLHINIQRKKDPKSKSLWSKIDDIKIAPTLKVMISMRDISELKVNGGGKIISENSIASNDLKLSVTGSGSMEVDIKGREIDATISGSGDMTLKGYASEADIIMSGPGALNGFDFELEKAQVSVSGSGSCEISVSDDLEAEIYGSGNLKHKGATKNVVKKVYGSGTVDRAY